MSYREMLGYVTRDIEPDVVHFVQLVALAERNPNAPQELREGLSALDLVHTPEAQQDPLQALLYLMERRDRHDDQAALAMRFLLRCFSNFKGDRRSLVMQHLHQGLLQPDLLEPPLAYHKLLLDHWLQWLRFHPQPQEGLEKVELVRLHLLELHGLESWTVLGPIFKKALSIHRARLNRPHGIRPGHAELSAYLQQLFPAEA